MIMLYLLFVILVTVGTATFLTKRTKTLLPRKALVAVYGAVAMGFAALLVILSVVEQVDLSASDRLTPKLLGSLLVVYNGILCGALGIWFTVQGILRGLQKKKKGDIEKNEGHRQGKDGTAVVMNGRKRVMVIERNVHQETQSYKNGD
jgi:hypothetical protein